MTIQVSEDKKQDTVDRETYQRLTTGTKFQRSLNCVIEMDRIMTEMDQEIAKHAGLKGLAKKAFLKKAKKNRAKYLKSNFPKIENFDNSAVGIFYD